MNIPATPRRIRIDFVSTTFIAIAMLAAGPAIAQDSKEWIACQGRNGETLDARISGCTSAIQASEEAPQILASAFFNRGNSYYSKRQYDLALRDYDQAIQLNPNHVGAFYNRGNVHRAKGQNDLAVRDYDQTIRLNPDHASAFNNRGIAYYEKREYDLAIRDYDHAIRLNPKHAGAFYNRGNVFRNKGENDLAIRDYDEAIRLDPVYAGAFHNRGNVYFAKSEYDRAIRDYDEAIKLNPKDASIFYARSKAKLQGGDATGSKADIDVAKAINPRLSDLSSGTGFFVSQNGHVLTNYHVVSRCRQVFIRSGDLLRTARVVATDTANDLALVTTDLKPPAIASWRYSIREGEEGALFGFPDLNGKVATGKVSILTASHDNGLRIFAPIEPGHSGSPVVDSHGYVVGVAWGKTTVTGSKSIVGNAIKSAVVSGFLDSQGVSHSDGGENESLPTADLIERIRAFTVLVACEFDPAEANDSGTCKDASGDAAIAACSRAIASQKFQGMMLSGLYFARGNAHARNNETDRAIDDYTRAIQINPKLSEAFNNRGNAYHRRGDIERAIEDYSQVIHLDPNDVTAFNNRGRSHLQKGAVFYAMWDFYQARRLDNQRLNS